MPRRRQPGFKYSALVFAEELFNTLERDRVYVPRVSGQVGDPLDSTVMRGVEPVVHARGDPKRDVAALAVDTHQLRIAEQIVQRVREAFGLD